MKTKEEEIANLMKVCDLTREEAEELWLDDHTDLPEPKKEGEKRRYTVTEAVKNRKSTKERKVDEQKKEILEKIAELLKELNANNVTIKTETEINFSFENDYTLKLTKHRAKKKEGDD